MNAITLRADKIVKMHKDSNCEVIVKMYKEDEYAVVGSTGTYSVFLQSDKGKVCECPAFLYGNGVDELGYCKHIHAVLMAIEKGLEIKEFDDIMEGSEDE